VWGGGIVKYKNKEDWLPWPIDLANESEGIPVPETIKSSNYFAQPKENDIKINSNFAASGVNVKRIDLPNSNKGNIHTGAIPPWELDDEDIKEKDDEDDNYLPNFGGVWNAGPRRTTREEFLKSLTEQKELAQAKNRLKRQKVEGKPNF